MRWEGVMRLNEAAAARRLEIAATVGNRGIPCTLGIFKVMHEMERIPAGAILEVLSTDRNSKRDLEKWTARVGHRIVAIYDDSRVLRPALRIQIKKKV